MPVIAHGCSGAALTSRRYGGGCPASPAGGRRSPSFRSLQCSRHSAGGKDARLRSAAPRRAGRSGVQDVITLPFIAKIAIAGWNEGSLKWRSIPREQTQLTQSTRYIETSTGLLNDNCDVVPVMMFLADHRAGTIERLVTAVKGWRNANPVAGAPLRLAAGNVGAMGATNETVKAQEMVILARVFAAVLAMCLLTFR